MRRLIATFTFLACIVALHSVTSFLRAQGPVTTGRAEPTPAVGPTLPPPAVFSTPAPMELYGPGVVPEENHLPHFTAPVEVPARPTDASGQRPAPRCASRQPLPINLATALRLADARPLIIEAARAAVETEYGLYEQAKVLWLPTVYIGPEYQRHDGAEQNEVTGQPIIGARTQFFAGAGAQAIFALADAIYAPLAEQQLLRARNFEVQTAKNEALLSVAQAYFDVQQARGNLAGTLDAITKARDLARRVTALGRGLSPAIEVERVNTLLANFEGQAAAYRRDWLTRSAALTRVLRLDPSAVVIPLEPPHLRVTVVSPKETVDSLIPVGLMNRPELETQQAVVQATLVRLKQERMRPLIPSVVLESTSTPDGLLGAGIYGNGDSNLNHWNGRSDWNAGLLWQFKNLGFGNRGLITQRRGEQRQALVELFRIQDQVAEDVSQAHAEVESAVVQMAKAEAEVKSGLASYEGNLRGLGETIRSGQLLQLVNRPQEVEAALQQLQQAYVNYYTSANDYNRAQFQLFRALGYPAQDLACGSGLGQIMPVSTARPPQMPPVNAPEPCRDCPH